MNCRVGPQDCNTQNLISFSQRRCQQSHTLHHFLISPSCPANYASLCLTFSPGHLLHHASTHKCDNTDIVGCNVQLLSPHFTESPSDLTDYPTLFLTFKSIFLLLSVNYNARFLGTRIYVFTFGVGTKSLFAVLIKSDSYTFIRSNSTFLFFFQATSPPDGVPWQIPFDHTPKGLPRWAKICQQTMGCLKGPSNTGLQL